VFGVTGVFHLTRWQLLARDRLQRIALCFGECLRLDALGFRRVSAFGVDGRTAIAVEDIIERAVSVSGLLR
jgi:hypothetical protein